MSAGKRPYVRVRRKGGQIDKNNQRYHNGRKGGRPKTKQDTVEKTEKPMVSNSETYGYDNENLWFLTRKPMVMKMKMIRNLM